MNFFPSLKTKDLIKVIDIYIMKKFEISISHQAKIIVTA